MPEERRIEMVTLQNKVSTLEDAISDNTEMTKEIHRAILGDISTRGLLTRMEVTETSLSRNWWFTGSIAVAILGAAFFVIRTAIT